MTVEWTSGVPVEIEAPLVVVAFEGWNDAVAAVSGAVDYVADQLDAEPIAELGGDECFDYLETRPAVTHRHGVPVGLSWPRIVASVCRPPGLDHDVVLVVGPEPALRWRRFATEFVDFVDTLDASQVVLLGAYLTETPHSRDLPLTGTAFSRARVEAMGVEPADYHGPTGMSGVLQQVLTDAGIPAISLWVGIPHYASSSAGLGGSYQVVRWLGEHLGVRVQSEALRRENDDWIARIQAAVAEDADLAEYVTSLEDDHDQEEAERHLARATEQDTDRMTLVDGDALAAEFERYLRGGGSDQHGGPEEG